MTGTRLLSRRLTFSADVHKSFLDAIAMLVTIGLVVRNCENTINDAVQSITAQDFPKNLTEVIAIDDRCTDETIPRIVKGLDKTGIQLRVFRTSGKGLGAARQLVVNHATGKYIVWVDGDMTLPKDHVRKQVEFMETNPEVGKARARWKSNEKQNLVSSLENVRLLNYESRHSKTSNPASKLVGIGGSICRVDALRQVGGFAVDIIGAGEDVDIAARLMKAGWKLEFTDAEFYHDFKTNWKDLWKQYVWYGYGSHYVGHKHKELFQTWSRTPPVAFAQGVSDSMSAYQVTHRRISFLLPIHNLFKQTAWCLGFLEAHMNGYGHA